MSSNAGSEWSLIPETHEVVVPSLHFMKFDPLCSARTSIVVRALPAFSVCDRVPRGPVPDTVSKFGNPLCLGAGVFAVPSLLNTCWFILVIFGCHV